ncbi:MAG: tRNA threonylcarbamoyladenosine dehydratase [Bacteroidetes bacterium GWF2_33_16]|nr:MAG: tRNA threonylcarbamoyladenosine dehydratase [Bacteroidetes bacterium GWE2_32_14]OFY04113.1 MAG: tRNA threonylcarbamoyladenosine dehydratase [Bacteroidetes bacterium GWF2_33_16]
MSKENWQERTELLIGKESTEKLKSAHVLVIGLGGVGAYAAESLCRAGIGELTIVDGDTLHPSNKNRQLAALESTMGKPKAEVIGARLIDINPELKLHIIQDFIKDDKMIEILDKPYDYVVDAIDTLSPKVYLIYHSLQKKLKIVSSLGSGARLDPSKIRITDLSKSYNCRLGFILRKRLRKLDVHKGFKVVFSEDKAVDDAVIVDEPGENKKSTVGTISYMPPIYGCMCASVVIRELIEA